MTRRIHVPRLVSGETPLDPDQLHHVRNVLRLTHGTAVEVFDDAGRVARGRLQLAFGEPAVVVDHVNDPAGPRVAAHLTVVSAVPKGERADWMVEKLCELGAEAFVPLAASRSVVVPEGKNKRERWVRLATEAAKQSRRAGVMRIERLLPDVGTALIWALAALESMAPVWFLSTEAEVPAVPINEAAAALPSGSGVWAFVGPEGGWAPDELRRFSEAGAKPVRLTTTILRVETAAVAVAAVVGCLASGRRASGDP